MALRTLMLNRRPRESCLLPGVTCPGHATQCGRRSTSHHPHCSHTVYRQRGIGSGLAAIRGCGAQAEELGVTCGIGPVSAYGYLIVIPDQSSGHRLRWDPDDGAEPRLFGSG